MKMIAEGLVGAVLVVLAVVALFSLCGGIALLLDMQSSSSFSHAHHNLFTFLKWGELGIPIAAGVAFIGAMLFDA